jgi:hypothetical protein
MQKWPLSSTACQEWSLFLGSFILPLHEEIFSSNEISSSVRETLIDLLLNNKSIGSFVAMSQIFCKIFGLFSFYQQFLHSNWMQPTVANINCKYCNNESLVRSCSVSVVKCKLLVCQRIKRC